MQIELPDDSTLDLLQQATGLSEQRIKLAMTQGAVWMMRERHTQRLRRAKRALRVGDEVHLYYDAAILAVFKGSNRFFLRINRFDPLFIT